MGPDEYHDSYPGADKPGLNNNVYTNLMVMFVMDQALNLQHVIPEQDWEYLRKNLGIEDCELVKFQKMSRRMKLVFHGMKLVFHGNGILSQFEGYENLKEFDWEGYKKKYGNIRRLDRILEKEGDSTNNYKLCKQADVLMILYLFSAEILRKMFKRLNYPEPQTAHPWHWSFMPGLKHDRQENVPGNFSARRLRRIWLMIKPAVPGKVFIWLPCQDVLTFFNGGMRVWKFVVIRSF